MNDSRRCEWICRPLLCTTLKGFYTDTLTSMFAELRVKVHCWNSLVSAMAYCLLCKMPHILNALCSLCSTDLEFLSALINFPNPKSQKFWRMEPPQGRLN